MSISEYEQAEQGEKFRQNTIKIYLKILKKNPNIPDALMQVIAWILGEYGSNTDEDKARSILNLLSQFSYGTFEDERTRASILLALTKLHSSLNFEQNEYVAQIMNDYLLSKNLEVQQRALDYRFLLQNRQNFPNNGKDLIFKIPLIEQHVQEQGFDLTFNFLEPFVQQQRAEGRPEYDQEKSQIVGSGGDLNAYGDGNLNFTPY